MDQAITLDDVRRAWQARDPSLAEDIRQLNIQIVEAEGGGVSKSDAVGLRDQRSLALSQLSELVDVRIDAPTLQAVFIHLTGRELRE